MCSQKNVRTRIAPSPTGEDIHLGNLYTAILSYAWAKKNNGKFIVRIEDTDKEREVKGSAQKILQTLSDYGVNADESPIIGGPYSPYVQSDRKEIYKKHAEDLVKSGHAYYCTCTKNRLTKLRGQQIKDKKPTKYDKHCLDRQQEVKQDVESGKPYVIRLNVERDKEIIVNDLLRGEVKFSSNDIDDQVLLKSDGFPTYHLAVVVDDNLMKVSHVIRAEDWLSSAPKHVLLYNAFGFELPVFAHTPLLRNADKSKLSKRKNPVWAGWYLKQGFLPEAVVNYLCLMGWSHPQQKEKFSMKEFVKVFDIKDVDTVGPIFDLTKLEWLNGQYIKDLSDSDFYNKCIDFEPKLKKLDQEKLKKILPLIKERVRKLSEVNDLIAYFFTDPSNFDEITELADKESKLSTAKTKEQMQMVLETLQNVSNWEVGNIDKSLHDLMEEKNIKPRQFFMPIRIVASGRAATPPLGETLEIIGKESVIRRIEKYLSA
jgi:glutamyl-tRNA synthetase